MDKLDELYVTLENACDKLQEYLNTYQYNGIGNFLIVRKAALNEKLCALKIEVLRKETDNLTLIYEKASKLQEVAKKIICEIDHADNIFHNPAKIALHIDEVLSQINMLVK